MPRIELKDQTDICKSITMQGGFGSKWASGWQIGKPDLICAFPSIGSFFMEVKSREINNGDKLVHLSTAPKQPHEKRQRYELMKLNNAGATAVLGVVVHYPDLRYKELYIVPWWVEQFGEFIFTSPIANPSEWMGKNYDVKFLITDYKRKVEQDKWRTKSISLAR